MTVFVCIDFLGHPLPKFIEVDTCPQQSNGKALKEVLLDTLNLVNYTAKKIMQFCTFESLVLFFFFDVILYLC